MTHPTTRDELRLVCSADLPSRQALYDFTGKVFSENGYYHWLRFCRRGYFEGGNYDWSASTVGLVGGELVTHWGVWDLSMRIGSGLVRAGGIGCVGTHGLHRREGLMARTVRGGLERMRDSGYDMTILFGIPDFYHRFGYVSAWPAQDYMMDVNRLPTDRPAGTVRRFTPGARRDLDELYNRQNAGQTGTVVRPTYRRNRYPSQWQGYLWTGRGGRAEGYVVVGERRGAFALMDSAGDPQQVLAVLGRLARRRGCKEVHLPCLPWCGGLAERLREGFCRIDVRYSRSGGAMIRTLDLASTLRKLRGELGRRLRASPLAGWRGELLIADRRGRVALRIGPRGIEVSPGGASRHWLRGGEHIAQLLIGRDEPREIIRKSPIRAGGDGLRLAEALFPARHPVMGWWDRM